MKKLSLALIALLIGISSSARAQKLLVIRHGQALNNILEKKNATVLESENFPLTDIGRRQILDAAKEIHALGDDWNQEHVQWIYASPLLRTRQTAEIIAKELGIDTSKIVIDYALIEKGTGTLEGTSSGERKQEEGKVRDRDDLDLIRNHGVERIAEMKARVESLVMKLGVQFPDRNIILVTHRSPMEAILEVVNPWADWEYIANGKYRIFSMGDSL